MVTLARSLRIVEQRTEQLARKQGSWMNVEGRHPMGNLAVSALRMMALCILALVRKLSRFGYSEETPSWGQVAEHFLLELCASNLRDQGLRHRLSSSPGVGLLRNLVIKKIPPARA